MASSLYSDDCSSVSKANSLFATEKGLLVLRPGGGGCLSWYFTVPSGCYALVTRHGADEDYVAEDGTTSPVWPPGLHYFYPPWMGVSNLVTMQSIVLDLPVKACKTKDNVTVNVDVDLVFRIMGDADRGEDPLLVRKFVYEVKPRGLEQQLRDAQEEAVRALTRSMRHTEIYGIRSGPTTRVKSSDKKDDASDSDTDDTDSVASDRDEVLEGSSDNSDRLTAKRGTRRGVRVAAEMRDRLNRQFVPQGVLIESVMITRVTLPDDITSQMTEKTMVISQNAQQRMYHENTMQNTRMEEEVAGMVQGFYEERMQETAAGEEKIGEEKVKLNDLVAQAKKSEANIREESQVRIEKMMAEKKLEEQRVKDRMYETITNIRAEAEKESAEMLANSRADAQSMIAEAELRSTQNHAEAQKVLSAAEGKIAPWIELKKEYETRKKEMNVYGTLAENDGLVVTGGEQNDDEGALLAVADAILARSDGEEGDDEVGARSRLMAELALIARGSSAFISPMTEGGHVSGAGDYSDGGMPVLPPNRPISVRDPTPPQNIVRDKRQTYEKNASREFALTPTRQRSSFL
eukprot:CAMPEP_0183304176 /NCGR_PEP_ID=MMETSP0160_2-20130417/9358_1 /TAXON_ID=2839 ORGANISM="Odontella Sinensis, Strain Grunow 1884" /NCGR_SAMPLE_ID=MMETSP0160_2 /ASSEMBLY_ACC=CAM_ASM_000250 /LENGTH=574 /DNA_ID=CAMNT_0025467185 /DNA_START=106 /DNA_END=1830 /DNA_ORIENTATION=+